MPGVTCGACRRKPPGARGGSGGHNDPRATAARCAERRMDFVEPSDGWIGGAEANLNEAQGARKHWGSRVPTHARGPYANIVLSGVS
jgi:hypothetical protein